MMASPLFAILGLDIGKINTRLPCSQCRMDAINFMLAPFHQQTMERMAGSGRGVVHAVRIYSKDQPDSFEALRKPYMADQDIRLSVDRIALASSACESVNTVLWD